MKVSELLKAKHVVADGNLSPAVPQAENEKREAEANDSFDLLDGTNPSKPYTPGEILKAMAELHRRIERQAAHYGGKIDQKTGKIDRSAHKFYDAQIARDE